MNIRNSREPILCYECGKPAWHGIEFGHRTKYPRVLCFKCVREMHDIIPDVVNTE